MSLRTRRGLALLASFMFVASACGGAQTTPTPSPAPATTAPASATPAPSPSNTAPDLTNTKYSPTPAASTGGTVVMAEWQSPDAINPYYAQAFTDIEGFGALSFDGMLNLTNDLKYVPDLAKEVPTVANGDVVVNGDKFDLTWKMKDGMKWSDGQPINCDDLIATWKWVMDPGNSGLVAGTVGWEDIGSIDGAGTTTCTVHFNKLYEGYISLFSPILPAHYLATVPNVADAVTKLYPLGNPKAGVYSGPYIPTEYKTDAQITFVPNPNWATISGHPPYLDKVIMQLFGDSAPMIAAFKAGSIDLAMDLNDGDIPSLTGIPTDQVMIHDSLTYELHAFNNASFKKKFGDDYATIIKAIKLTTDRAAIIAGPRQGNATPTNNFISPLTWYYKDEGPQPPADPATAASILAQAGWTAGSDGILTKNGVKLEVQYCTTKLQIRGDTLALVASQLKKVGIQADVLQVPAQPDYFGGWNSVANDTKCNLVHGNFDVAEFAYISPLDPLGGYSVYHSSGIPDAPPHNGQNITRISLPALDAAYDAVKNNVDYSKVRDAMYQVQDIYGSDQNTFELPLFYRKDVWLVNPKLQNFVGNPSNVSGEWNVGDWWLQK